jgi:hypothetical protein
MSGVLMFCSRFGCFWTNGQICSATSRLLVQESLAERFLARLVEEANKIHIGAPCDDANKPLKGILASIFQLIFFYLIFPVFAGMLGPIVCKQQYDRVMSHVQTAVAEGAEVLCGAKRPVFMFFTSLLCIIFFVLKNPNDCGRRICPKAFSSNRRF